MKRLVLSTALLATLAAAPALASEKCSVAKADRQPQTALQQKLEAEGWTVRRIKVDKGCYEVYGFDAAGKRMESYFHPQTFALVAANSED